MTTPASFRIASTPPSPDQRVKLLTTPLGWSWLWFCACGANGRPELSEADAYLDWEAHRENCPLRPERGE